MGSDMRVCWLAEHRRAKDDFLSAVATAAGQGRRLTTAPLSLRDFPQTAGRVADCMARAKKRPASALGRAAKRLLIRAQYNGARRFFTRHPDALALCWNGLTGSRRAVMLGARDAGAPRLFAELAPLPGFLTLDPAGVNAEGSVPQDPAAYDTVTPDAPLIADLRDRLVARAPRRADVGQGQGDLPDAPFLFVPLQVPDDSQVRLFSGWAGDLPGFIAALGRAADALPPGWHLRLKEHPSAKQPLSEIIAAAGSRLVLDNDTDSFAQLRASRGVLTLNSSMGLQAFFHDTPVIVTGRAFFALPGLADHAPSEAALTDLLARAGTLGFDAGLRDRFLTWLAREYYIPWQDGPTAGTDTALRRALGRAMTR